MRVSAGRSRPGHRHDRRLAGAAVVLFLSFVDVFALLPTVAPHVRSLGAGLLGVGVAVGAYSATNLPAGVAGGVLVDRWGRRPVVIGSLGLAAAVVATYPLASTTTLFVLVRLAHGVVGGLMLTAILAAAGDRVRTGEEGRSFGRLGALIGAAAVVSPALAGLVRQLAGTTAVFLGISGVLLVAAVVATVSISEPAGGPSAGAVPSGEEPSAHRGPARTATATAGLLAVSRLRRGLIATVAMTAAAGSLAAFLPAAAEAAGAEPAAVGGLFTAYAVVAGAIMLSPIAGRAEGRGAARVAVTGLATLAAALLWLAVASPLWALAVGSALFGVGYGLVFPAVMATTSSIATRSTRGRAFGLFSAAFSLGIAVGPPLVGAAASWLSWLDPFAYAAFAVATVAIVLARPGD